MKCHNTALKKVANLLRQGIAMPSTTESLIAEIRNLAAKPGDIYAGLDYFATGMLFFVNHSHRLDAAIAEGW